MVHAAAAPSGVQIQFLHQIQEERHLHQELEIVYVIEGTLFVQQDAQEFSLEQNDLMVLNSNHFHSLRGEGALLQVRIPYAMISALQPESSPAFSCNSAADSTASYHEMRALLRQLMFSCAEAKKKSPARQYSCIYALLDILLEKFQIEEKQNWSERDQRDEERLQTLISYVNQNFQEQINLGKLAEQMYTSTSSLSRLFKKNMDCYFGDYVNQVRLNYAVQELEHTRKTVTRIAADCGFASLASFNKQFQNAYGTSPTAYRKEHQAEAEPRVQDYMPNSDALAKELKQLGMTDDRQRDTWETRTIQAEILPAACSTVKRSWNMILNGGAAYDLTSANVQNQITYLYEHLKFRYVRIWNIFSERLMIRSDEKSRTYNFNMLDSIFDYMVDKHICPYLNFGYRPNCAVKAEQHMVYYEEEYLLFQDSADWMQMFRAFLHHLMKRYGREEMSRWVFDFAVDIRNQRIYFCKDEQEIWQLYQQFYLLMKGNLPNASVGGLDSALPSGRDFTQNWLEFCKENNCVPDHLSVVVFPYIQQQWDDGYGAKRMEQQGAEVEQLREWRNILDKTGLSACRLYVGEWNCSLSTRNWINDSCFRGTYLLHFMNQAWGLADALGIWMGSDLCSSYYDTAAVANGGNGIITKDGIRKTIYHALAFLNRIHAKCLARGENYIVTTNDMGSYYILCYNFKWYSYRYFAQAENEIEVQQLSEMFTDQSDLQMEITLRGLPANRGYAIKQRTINDSCGSLLGEWSRFEYDTDLDGRDIEYLRKVCVPKLSKRVQLAVNGTLSFGTTLKAHEMTLFHIYAE